MAAQKPAESGMSLVEVVVAAALLAILAAGVGGLVVFLLRAERALEYRAEAMDIAETELDRIHALDDGGGAFPPGTTEPVSGHDGFTKRMTRVYGNDLDEEMADLVGDTYVLVTVTVSWEKGDAEGSVTMSGGHYPWSPDNGTGHGKKKGWQKWQENF